MDQIFLPLKITVSMYHKLNELENE